MFKRREKKGRSPARSTGQTINPAPQRYIRSRPQLVMQQDMEEARKLASDMGVTVEQLLGPQDDNLPKAVPVRTYVVGQPFVTKDEWLELPTHMRALHNWYMNEIVLVPERK